MKPCCKLAKEDIEKILPRAFQEQSGQIKWMIADAHLRYCQAIEKNED